MTSAGPLAGRGHGGGALPGIPGGPEPAESAGIPADGVVPPRAGARGRRSVRVVGRSLLALTKPRIIELLLVTTVPTMMLAARGLPAAGLLPGCCVRALVHGVFVAGDARAAGAVPLLWCMGFWLRQCTAAVKSA